MVINCYNSFLLFLPVCFLFWKKWLFIYWFCVYSCMFSLLCIKKIPQNGKDKTKMPWSQELIQTLLFWQHESLFFWNGNYCNIPNLKKNIYILEDVSDWSFKMDILVLNVECCIFCLEVHRFNEWKKKHQLIHFPK